MKMESNRVINERLAEILNLPPGWRYATVRFGYDRVPLVTVEYIPGIEPKTPAQPEAPL